MKTQFIIREGWRLIKEYDFIVPASSGDYFALNNEDYVIKSVLINADENIIIYTLTQ